MKKLFLITSMIFLSLSLISCDSEPIELSDHDWKVTELTGVSATNEQLNNLTLVFGEDQEINGFAGCNEYRGGATYNREQIKFSTLYTDSENCDDISMEKQFLANMESSTTYTYSADKLVLFDDAGNIMVELEKQ